jgi:hypothetical protein
MLSKEEIALMIRSLAQLNIVSKYRRPDIRDFDSLEKVAQANLKDEFYSNGKSDELIIKLIQMWRKM